MSDTGDSTTEVKAQIALLEEMASAIMNGEGASLEARAYQDKSLPILAIVDRLKASSMDAKAGPADLGNKVGDVVGQLFSGHILDALKTTITSGLNLFLGNASEGRSDSTEFHIVYNNNAFLRIDIYFYKYNFESEALKKVSSNLFCYVAQVGIVDHVKMNPQIALYELSKSLPAESIEETRKNMKLEAAFAQDLYSTVKSLASYSLTSPKALISSKETDGDQEDQKKVKETEPPKEKQDQKKEQATGTPKENPEKKA